MLSWPTFQFLVFERFSVFWLRHQSCLVWNAWLKSWTQTKGSAGFVHKDNWCPPADSSGQTFLLCSDLLLQGMRTLSFLLTLPFSNSFIRVHVWVSLCFDHFIQFIRFPARVAKRYGRDLFFSHQTQNKQRSSAGVTDTLQAVCTDGHPSQHKNQNTGWPDFTTWTWKHHCTTQSHIMRQKPDAVQVRGRDITKSRTDQLHPACFQMDRCFCSFHSDAFNYKHVVHKRRVADAEESSPHVGVSYLHFTALHQLNEVSEQDVSVPLTEPVCIVGHLQRGTQRDFSTTKILRVSKTWSKMELCGE